jgi:hypothetical protein
MKRTRVIIAVGLLCAVAIVLAQQPVSQGPQAANAAEWIVNATKWANGALGAMANYGTSPGAVLVPGVNAFVTNAISTTAPTPSTSSTFAYTRYHASSAAVANIKASAGNLYGLVVGNSGTIPCWLQLFNTAGTPTAGTSVVDSFMVQAGTTMVITPGQLALENFATGIGAAGATADSGATVTGCTTTVSVTAFYQ